jgi:preprotein translocase subunit SecY
MTPLRRISNLFREYGTSLRREQYLKINLILAGVIVLVFAYSGIFSPDTNNYPVVCIHEKLTGEPCFSCGLSHSFSLIVRGRISEAYEWNKYGLQVFFFFLFQLLLRIAFSVFYIQNPGNRKRLIPIDIGGSILLFLVAFYPFLKNLVTNL